MRKTLVVLGLGFFAFCAMMAMLSSGSKTSAATASSPATEPTSTCSAADFSISKTRANAEYDVAKLTGIVTNHCKTAKGVQLKWTAFNSDGTVAFSQDFWPASTANIPPGDYAFEMMNTAPRGKWTYRVEAISTQTW